MVVYVSASAYIKDCTDLQERLVRIKAIITALENMALDAIVASEGVSEYTLDDGQTKISESYKDISQITRSINAFEQIKNRLIRDLSGSNMVQLMDQSNFRRRC